MDKALRILFFSDWRIQSLELAEVLIQSVAPLDVIVYGGDDVARFAPPPEVPATMTVAGRIYFPESFIPPDKIPDLLLILSEQLGQEPRNFWPGRRLTLRQVFALYRDLSPANNWLSKLSQYARYGVLGVIGNDCDPIDRAVLHAQGVRDLHVEPTVIGNVGFLGIEGAIYNGVHNHIGFVLHDEAEVRGHLETLLQRLGALPERLIIVSHTPPAGCRLDTGIRFGFDRLVSEALKDFVLEYQPALVLCGHCHSRGGKSALLGSTLVVNAASDDTNPRGVHVALIKLGKPPTLTWLTPPRGLVGPNIGPKRAATLTAFGITRIEEILESPVVRAAIQFGPVRTALLHSFVQAQTENAAVWLTHVKR
jgi:Icc-related predicted phosphoesterase